MTIVGILKKARRVIARPEKWTKGVAARDKNGRECAPFAKEARCFCAIGAVERVAMPDYGAVRDAISALDAATRWKGTAEYNDSPRRTHAQILALFDRAIAKLGTKKGSKK